MYNGNLLYTLDLEKKITYPISLGTIEFNNNVRQITKKDFEETHKRTDLKPGDIL